MHQIRIIPSLLLCDKDLVKTKQFSNPVYLGDPINAVKIFNEKFVSELMVLDINASKFNRSPDFDLLTSISKDCFVPLSYGGGVSSLDDALRILRIGVEKVVINSALFHALDFVADLVKIVGSQAVVASVDVKGSANEGYKLVSKSALCEHNITLDAHLKRLIDVGVGEILLTNISRDGMMGGYDLELIKKVSSSVNIPIIALGGAGSISHMEEAIKFGGADAVAAGSMFVFLGRLNAVLINYPQRAKLFTNCF